MNKHSEHKYVVDSLDTPVSTTEPTPDTTDQAVTLRCALLLDCIRISPETWCVVFDLTSLATPRNVNGL